MNRMLFVLLFGVLPLVWGAAQSTAVSPNAAAKAAVDSDAVFFPPSTLVYAQVSRGADLISLVFDHPLRNQIEALPPYQMAIQTPGYKQFVLGRSMVEGQLEMSWREAMDTALAGRVSLAWDVDTQGVAALIQGKDAESMKMIHEKMRGFAQFAGDDEDFWQGEYRGVSAFRVNNVRVAVHEDRILIANHSDLGKRVIDRMLDGGSSLADNVRFQDARRSDAAKAIGWGYVDLHKVRESNLAPAVFNDQVDNPVLELLVGGIQSTIKQAPFATLAIDADRQTLEAQIELPFQADWIPEEREYFFGASGDGRGPQIPEIEQTLFTLSTHRDFAGMWLRAGDLYGPEINDGFAKADASLTTLFAGRDFGEDILGSLEPEVGFVATRQNFDNVLPKPTIKLPAFAVVAQLRDPDEMTRELRRIFQSLVGFLNVVGAMNGQSQLELDMEKLEGDAQIVSSTYVPEPDESQSTDAKIVFNFSPSVGFAGDRFVVASTKDLARRLTVAPRPNPALIADNTQSSLDAHVLRDVLADNREQLIAQNMLEDGHSREEAEAVIELVLQVIDFFQDAAIRLGQNDDRLEIELRLRVQPQ